MATKVTVVGAGAVGATCANVLAARGIASEVVLVDIKEGLSEGKMLDMFQAAATCGYKTKLTGVTATDAEGYKATANSDVIVITSGIPRKPGMTREELIGINANIVKSVVANASKWSPKAIYVIISNPMDTMTYLTLKSTGLKKNRVIGMGGALDSSRFRCYLSKATGVGIQDIDGMVIGGHGDTTMLPLLSKASIKGVPATQFLSKKKLEEVAAATMVGGATLTKLLGTSAWYAPGAAGASVVDAIINDTKAVVPCSVYLEGEYGQEDICIGVPVVLGKKGVEKIVKIDLTKEEQEKFAASADATRKVNNALYEIGAL
ncbi:MAG: malate dehydrogenase [Alistipes sp.]|nr:malate dehydrogenase [Alistipes sp.]